jgi:hypothetical protein
LYGIVVGAAVRANVIRTAIANQFARILPGTVVHTLKLAADGVLRAAVIRYSGVSQV